MTDRSMPPVMILGCGRSGTSIFGEMFSFIEGYTYQSEPPFDDVMAADYSRPQAFKVPRESGRYPAQPGLSFPVTAVLNRAPEMKFFWIVRHPLDAISTLRVGISQNWGHHPRPPDWKQWLERPLIEQCAHHWAYINSVGYDRLAGRATLVRFEAMIHDPIRFAHMICRTIGLGPGDRGTALESWAQRVQNTDNANFVEAAQSRNYSRRDHSVRVGRWRENLSEKEASAASKIVASANSRYGYWLPSATGDPL
jgi:hypothetical protein